MRRMTQRQNSTRNLTRRGASSENDSSLQSKNRRCLSDYRNTNSSLKNPQICIIPRVLFTLLNESAKNTTRLKFKRSPQDRSECLKILYPNRMKERAKVLENLLDCKVMASLKIFDNKKMIWEIDQKKTLRTEFPSLSLISLPPNNEEKQTKRSLTLWYECLLVINSLTILRNMLVTIVPNKTQRRKFSQQLQLKLALISSLSQNKANRSLCRMKASRETVRFFV